MDKYEITFAKVVLKKLAEKILSKQMRKNWKKMKNDLNSKLFKISDQNTELTESRKKFLIVRQLEPLFGGATCILIIPSTSAQ